MKNYLYDIKKSLDQRNFEKAQILVNKCNIDTLSVDEQAQLLLYRGLCSFEMKGMDKAKEDFMECIMFCKENKISNWPTPYYELSLVFFRNIYMEKKRQI